MCMSAHKFIRFYNSLILILQFKLISNSFPLVYNIMDAVILCCERDADPLCIEESYKDIMSSIILPKTHNHHQ